MKLNFVFVVVAVLACHCALADDYNGVCYAPPRSCEYTFKQEWTNDEGGVVEIETNINGLFFRNRMVTKDQRYSTISDTLDRTDLSDDPDDHVKKFIYSGYFQGETPIQEFSELQWITPSTFQTSKKIPFGVNFEIHSFPITFESVEETTCNGVGCKKYHLNDDTIVVCTDMNGLPISGSYQTAKEGKWNAVFHLTKEAPLSKFKFKTDAVFGDVRVYKDPEYSLCSDDD